MLDVRTFLAIGAYAFALGASPVHAQSDVPAGLAFLPSLLAPACAPVPYEPLPVYDFPGGVRSGQLVLDRPEWAQPSPREPNEPCLQSPQLQVQLEGQNSLVPAPVLKVRDEPTLVVQEVQSGPQGIWLKFESNKRRFWLPLARGVMFKSLERDLVQGLGMFNEVCDTLGECRPTSTAQRRLADDAALTRSPNCPLPAYLVEGVATLPTGRRAYQVRLAPELWPQFAHQLPVQALVPVRGFDGQWSGMFNPQPCASPAGLKEKEGDAAASAPGAEQAEGKIPSLEIGEAAEAHRPPSMANAAPLRHLPPLPARGAGATDLPAGIGLPPLMPPPALPAPLAPGRSAGAAPSSGILEFTPE